MTEITPSFDGPNWGPRTKRTILLLVFLGFLLALWIVRDILPLLVVSTVLAYLLSPVSLFIERRILVGPLRSRSLAIVLTFIVFIFMFIVILLVIVPGLIGQLEDFGKNLPEFVSSFEAELERILNEPLTFNGEPILFHNEQIVPLQTLQEITGKSNLEEILQLENFDLTGAIRTFIGSVGSLTGPAFNFLGGAFTTLINASFLLMMMFYLMKDGHQFARTLVNLAPEDYQDDVQHLLQALSHVWDAYLRGQIILCFVIGVIVYLAALLLGVPNAPILGLLAGFLEFIPNLGPFLALIPAAFLALVSQSATLPFLEGVPFMIAVIVVWTSIQNIEAVVLVPRVIGDSLDLHPFVVVLGVLGGASVAGALGVILAAPFIASARVLGVYIYGKLMDKEPFASDDTPPEKPNSDESPGFLGRLWQRIRPHDNQTKQNSQNTTQTETMEPS